MEYRVEYLGVHCDFFPTRDDALYYILNATNNGLAFEDFEILDNSDEL